MLINKRDLVSIVHKCLKEETDISDIKYVGDFKSKKGDGMFEYNKVGYTYEKFKTKNLAIAIDEKGNIFHRLIGTKKYKKHMAAMHAG